MYSAGFEFNKDRATTKVALPSEKSLTYSYDSIERVKSKTLNLDNSKTFNIQYGYKAGYTGSTTSMVSSVKNGSSEIKYTYDAIGNPLTYDGYTFKWEGGRTLSSIAGNSKNISYKYNSDGIRTEKQ